jgi:[acyl-carrier-protein] S-malonyltransferase
VLALLFPGQGSQATGMGRDVYEASPAARSVFEVADAVLGMPLSKLCFEGPDEALLPTEVQQPAILTTSIALLRALEERSGRLAPAYVAGHSLGEYSALVAAGALALEDALRLVRARLLHTRRGAAGTRRGGGDRRLRSRDRQAACKRAATGKSSNPPSTRARPWWRAASPV